MAGTKRQARAIALQALYEIIALGEPVDEAVAHAVKMHEAGPEAAEQARRLVHALLVQQAREQPEAPAIDVPDDEAVRLSHTLVHHIGRILALQTLYEVDLAGHTPHIVLERLQQEQMLPPEAVDFARALIKGVLTHKRQIDEWLAKTAPTWPVEQIAPIDRNILRLAIYEILLDNKTPVRAAINEAVELAKTFGSDNSAKFVNGVLGAISLSQHNKLDPNLEEGGESAWLRSSSEYGRSSLNNSVSRRSR